MSCYNGMSRRTNQKGIRRMSTNKANTSQVAEVDDEDQEEKQPEVVVFDPDELASRMLKQEELNDEEGHEWCICFEGLDKEIIIADPSYTSQADMDEHLKHARSDLAQNIRKLTNLVRDNLIVDLEHRTNKEILELKNQKRIDEAEILKDFFINHVKKIVIGSKESVETDLMQLDHASVAEKMLTGMKLAESKWDGNHCIQLKDMDSNTVIVFDPGYENAEHLKECLTHARETLTKNFKQIVDEAKDGLLADLQRSADFEVFTLKSKERFAEASVIQDYHDRIVKVAIEESKKDKVKEEETEEEEETK